MDRGVSGSHPHVMQKVGKIHASAGREGDVLLFSGQSFVIYERVLLGETVRVLNWCMLILTRSGKRNKVRYIAAAPTLCKDTSDGYTVSVLDGSLTQTEQVSENRIRDILGKEGVMRKYPNSCFLRGSAVLKIFSCDSGFSYDDTALILSPLSLVSKKSNLSGKAGSPATKIDINKKFQIVFRQLQTG
ncbi:MAG: hypothetical protein ACLTZI_02425 [[Eubacterium] siraeum]